uniref:Uncharacterized protein n=1 Tax=Quercus lobata TaxID=97700 RepID=A0A7N2LJH4_QUELO
MALLFSTLSNRFCFIIGLRSTLSWFGRNPIYNIIAVLRSKQILVLPLTTTFVHKITCNKVCIDLSCFRGLGWLGNPSPADAPVPNLRSPVVSLQLLGLPAEAEVRNKQQLGWFLRPESQVGSIFHFFMLFQQVAVDEDGKKCWGILQIVFHLTFKTTSKAPAHQNSAFGVSKWSPKPYSMSPLLWDPKVIVAGTFNNLPPDLIQHAVNPISKSVLPINIYTISSPTYKASTMMAYVSPICFASSSSSSLPPLAYPESISF